MKPFRGHSAIYGLITNACRKLNGVSAHISSNPENEYRLSSHTLRIERRALVCLTLFQG